MVAKRRREEVDDFILFEIFEVGIILSHFGDWLGVEPVAMIGNVPVGATAGAVVLHRMRQHHLLPFEVDGRMVPTRIVRVASSGRAGTTGRPRSRVKTGVAAKLTANGRESTRQPRPSPALCVVVVGGILFGVVGASDPRVRRNVGKKQRKKFHNEFLCDFYFQFFFCVNSILETALIFRESSLMNKLLAHRFTHFLILRRKLTRIDFLRYFIVRRLPSDVTINYCSFSSFTISFYKLSRFNNFYNNYRISIYFYYRSFFNPVDSFVHRI